MSIRIAPGLVVLAFASCGGGEEGPSKAEYIAAADKICASAGAQAKPLLAELSTVNPLSLDAAGSRRIAATVDSLHAVGTDLVADLGALEQPGEDAEAIEAFLGSMSTLVDTIGRAGESLRTGATAGALAALSGLQSTSIEVRDSAEAYGFKQCGEVVNLP